MPFRAIPSDKSYFVQRGINSSDIFAQNKTAARGTGRWLEPSAATCTDYAVTARDAKTAASAPTINGTGFWGFKEHASLSQSFYIYWRGTNRSTAARSGLLLQMIVM